MMQGRFGETPTPANAIGATPMRGLVMQTPTQANRLSRFSETPVQGQGITSRFDMKPSSGIKPVGGFSSSGTSAIDEEIEKDLRERNRPMTD